jgi:hypothetical protein
MNSQELAAPRSVANSQLQSCVSGGHDDESKTSTGYSRRFQTHRKGFESRPRRNFGSITRRRVATCRHVPRHSVRFWWAGILLLLAHNWDSLSRPTPHRHILPFIGHPAAGRRTIMQREASTAWREGVDSLTLALGITIALVSDLQRSW